MKLVHVSTVVLLATSGCFLVQPDSPADEGVMASSDYKKGADLYDGTFGSHVKELYDETPMYKGAPTSPIPHVGRIPVGLVGDSTADPMGKFASTARGMPHATASFKDKEGDKICFSDLSDELRLAADASEAYRMWREELDVRVEVLKTLASRKATPIWPSSGAPLEDFTVTSDEVKDVEKDGVIRRQRVVHYKFCAKVDVPADAKAIAMVLHRKAGPPDDQSVADGLLLWSIQADTSAPPARE